MLFWRAFGTEDGATRTIHEDGSRKFTVYGAAEENDRDKGMQTRKMVRTSPSLCAAIGMLIHMIYRVERYAIFCVASMFVLAHSLACHDARSKMP